jgi:hypothetical protein
MLGDMAANVDTLAISTATGSDSPRNNGLDAEPSSEIQANSRCVTNSISEFCRRCQNVFKNWERFLETPSYGDHHHQNIFELEMAATSGCPLCYQFLRSRQHDMQRIRNRVASSSPDSRFGSFSVKSRRDQGGSSVSTPDSYTLQLGCNYTMDYVEFDGHVESLPQKTPFVVIGVPSKLLRECPPHLFHRTNTHILV